MQRVMHDRVDRLLRDARLAPRPGAIDPTASRPPPSNLRRHRRTVSGDVPHSRAIASFATPSAANTNADACTTTR